MSESEESGNDRSQREGEAEIERREKHNWSLGKLARSYSEREKEREYNSCFPCLLWELYLAIKFSPETKLYS